MEERKMAKTSAKKGTTFDQNIFKGNKHQGAILYYQCICSKSLQGKRTMLEHSARNFKRNKKQKSNFGRGPQPSSKY